MVAIHSFRVKFSLVLSDCQSVFLCVCVCVCRNLCLSARLVWCLGGLLGIHRPTVYLLHHFQLYTPGATNLHAQPFKNLLRK